jgi:hypothetical protein
MNEKSISNAGTKALHDVIHFLSGFYSALFVLVPDNLFPAIISSCVIEEPSGKDMR